MASRQDKSSAECLGLESDLENLLWRQPADETQAGGRGGAGLRSREDRKTTLQGCDRTGRPRPPSGQAACTGFSLRTDVYSQLVCGAGTRLVCSSAGRATEKRGNNEPNGQAGSSLMGRRPHRQVTDRHTELPAPQAPGSGPGSPLKTALITVPVNLIITQVSTRPSHSGCSAMTVWSSAKWN